jgi:hypothetical protein
MTQQITIEHGQSLLDAAMQAYGSPDGLFWLIADNPDLQTEGVDTYLAAGQVLVYRVQPANPVQAQYLLRGTVVNTGDLPAALCPDDYFEPGYTICGYFTA